MGFGIITHCFIRSNSNLDLAVENLWNTSQLTSVVGLLAFIAVSILSVNLLVNLGNVVPYFKVEHSLVLSSPSSCKPSDLSRAGQITVLIITT